MWRVEGACTREDRGRSRNGGIEDLFGTSWVLAAPLSIPSLAEVYLRNSTEWGMDWAGCSVFRDDSQNAFWGNGLAMLVWMDLSAGYIVQGL